MDNTMIDEHDRTHHNSMLNRIEIMREALEVFAYGRGRLGGMAKTLLAANTEIKINVDQAWKTLNDPRWQGPSYVRFVAQRHAELALAYSLVQTVYDELCDFGVVPKEMRTEQTTRDMATALAAEQKVAKKRRTRVAA